MSSEAASLAPKQLPQMSTDQIRIGTLTRFHLMVIIRVSSVSTPG
jgi:hypothetical protein